MLYIGKAQEKARVVRTERRHHPELGPYPWLVSSTAMVNHYYFYPVHADYKRSRIEQYHKEGRALCAETVVNDT